MKISVSRETKREAVLREIKMRKRVYPRWVADGRMTEAEAAKQIAIMEAIAEDYAEPDLFGGQR